MQVIKSYESIGVLRKCLFLYSSTFYVRRSHELMSVKPSQNSPNEHDLEITHGTSSDLELSSCSTATTGSDVVSCILKNCESNNYNHVYLSNSMPADQQHHQVMDIHIRLHNV